MRQRLPRQFVSYAFDVGDSVANTPIAKGPGFAPGAFSLRQLSGATIAACRDSKIQAHAVMPEPQPNPTRSEQIERDGVTCDIGVFPVEGGFGAVWTCTVCNQRGTVAAVCNSEAAALGRAKGTFFQHHVRKHLMGFG